MYDVIIIGNGLMGSAATRYLSATGLHVAGIGPSEPDNWKTHQGVFASHHDQGRITRIIDPDHLWARLAKRAIASYPEIERRSVIRFHHATSGLRLSAAPTAPDDNLARAEKSGRDLDAIYTNQDADRLRTNFPFFHFPDSSVALWEQGGAGYINPRAMVQAQLTVAAQQGVDIIDETVTTIDRSNGQWTVVTDTGQQYRAAKVLIAAGAYTNQLLARKLALRPRKATVLLAQISDAEAARLQQMPTLIYRLPVNPTLYSIYCLPPIRYPDGHSYIKLGGTFHTPDWCDSPDDLRDWFYTDGDQARAATLKEVLLDFLPNLAVKSFHTKPCVVTFTTHDHPYVDELEAGLFVAAGGCGAAGKSGDEVGRIAALLVETGAWSYDVAAARFQACYQ